MNLALKTREWLGKDSLLKLELWRLLQWPHPYGVQRTPPSTICQTVGELFTLPAPVLCLMDERRREKK